MDNITTTDQASGSNIPKQQQKTATNAKTGGSSLAEFFQDENHFFSATRLAFLSWIFVVLTIWGIGSFRDHKMQEIPDSVQFLIGVLMTGKVAQKFVENPTNKTTA